MLQVEALRLRRVHRDAEKRVTARDLRLALERELNEQANERADGISKQKIDEKLKATNGSVSVNGKGKGKVRGSREKDSSEREKADKSVFLNGITKAKHKSRIWREREGNGREKGRSSKERDGHEMETHAGHSKSRIKARTEKEKEVNERGSVPNGKPKNKSKGNVRANGSSSNADALRHGHRANADAAGGANINRARTFLRSYPNGIRK